MKDKRTLVLFDFDGTLTTNDTLFAFAQYATGNMRFFFGMLLLAFPLVLHKMKLVSAHNAKEFFLSFFFSGMNFTSFKNLGKGFAKEVLPSLIRPQAMDEILKYRSDGVRMVIVSASVGEWIKPWSELWGIEVIATKLKVRNDVITGRIDGSNCNGIEKVNRLREIIKLEEYEVIVAYGDTAGDLPMLELASKQYFKPFR